MQRIRYGLMVLGLLLCSAGSSAAELNIGIGIPSASIGIDLRAYPDFVVVPGYPVYYAPREDLNLFFYDGMYWVYRNDTWYESSWYNGPWTPVDPAYVQAFILRIPVSYYRQPPAYFAGWRSDEPPHWGDHWGRDWELRRSGWDRWDRRATPAPAPLPVYQRQFSGDRYPRQAEQQHLLQQQHYRYQAREPVVGQHLREPAVQPPPAPRQTVPEERRSRQQEMPRAAPPQSNGAATPSGQLPKRGGEEMRMPAPVSAPQGLPAVQEHRQPQALDRGKGQAPGPQQREERPRDAGQERGAGQAQGREQEGGRERKE